MIARLIKYHAMVLILGLLALLPLITADAAITPTQEGKLTAREAAAGPAAATPIRHGTTKLTDVGTNKLGNGIAASLPKCGPVAGVTTTDLTTGLTADQLGSFLQGEGTTISNVTYSGTGAAVGKFSGGGGIIGFEEGIILSTGNIAAVAGPNCSGSETTQNGTPGDDTLEKKVTKQRTFDAAVLAFDFVVNQLNATQVSFQYVFSSEEYQEWVNTPYNDGFLFLLTETDPVSGLVKRKENCALIGRPPAPISINDINNGHPTGTDPNGFPASTVPSNPQLYINNDNSSSPLFNLLEMDGLTRILVCEFEVTPGTTYNVRLVIADASDDQWDSNLFIRASSFTTGNGRISLDLPTDTNPAGTQHTVTATITDSNGVGIKDTPVKFDVRSGPNQGEGLERDSDQFGQVAFTYTGSVEPGTDTIHARFRDIFGSIFKTTATKTWVKPPNKPPNGTIDAPQTNVTIEVGQSVNFLGTGTDQDGKVAAFRWSFVGGSPSTSSVEDPGPVVYNLRGTFNVTFTVTDNAGVPDPTPDRRVITVTAPQIIIQNGHFLNTGIRWLSDTAPLTFDGKTLILTNGGPNPGISVKQGSNSLFHAKFPNHTLSYMVLGNKYLLILDRETVSGPLHRRVLLVNFATWTEVLILEVTSSSAVSDPVVNPSQGNGTVFLAYGQDGTQHTSVAIRRSDNGVPLCSLDAPIIPTGQTAGEATDTNLIIHYSTGGTSKQQTCPRPL